ncbi:MAG: hypothetical protein OEY77_12410 [Nitrospira sp.]|nr:hypothetical protein [Nitrospira sp.]
MPWNNEEQRYFRSPSYKWSLPEDLASIRHVLEDINVGRVHVVLITNAIQVDHVVQVLE